MIYTLLKKSQVKLNVMNEFLQTHRGYLCEA